MTALTLSVVPGHERCLLDRYFVRFGRPLFRLRDAEGARQVRKHAQCVVGCVGKARELPDRAGLPVQI